MDQAREMLSELDQKEFLKYHSIRVPPTKEVEFVMAQVCIMLGVASRHVRGDNDEEREDFWQPVRQHVLSPAARPAFLARIGALDPETINPNIAQCVLDAVSGLSRRSIFDLKGESYGCYAVLLWLVAVCNRVP